MTQASPSSKNSLIALIVGAIGVVYGDIGTSPLYALREAFGGDHPLDLNKANLFGVLSLFFWSFITVVSLKYIMLVMRADNRSEGGAFALLALVRQVVKNRTFLITALGIFGAALFYGDGIITPAISILSAVEGLSIATPTLTSFILPITLFIIVVLFGIQQNVSDFLGKFFGPVTCLWFIAISSIGLYHIVQTPSILMALSPYYAFAFFAAHPLLSFFTLGTIVLLITGVEALYADMGHFGLKPIRIAWLYFVMLYLMLNYLGQGALLARMPEALSESVL